MILDFKTTCKGSLNYARRFKKKKKKYSILAEHRKCILCISSICTKQQMMFTWTSKDALNVIARSGIQNGYFIQLMTILE